MKKVYFYIPLILLALFSFQSFIPENIQAQSSYRKRLPISVFFSASNRNFGLEGNYFFDDFLSVGLSLTTLSSDEGNIVKSETQGLVTFRIYPFDSLNLYLHLGYGNSDSSWTIKACDAGQTSGCPEVKASFPEFASTYGIGNMLISRRNNISGGIALLIANFGGPKLEGDETAIARVKEQFSPQLSEGESSTLITGYYGIAF